MKRDERLSVALHALMHMAERAGEPMTSAELAACAGTNPVVIRRTFAGLRERGIVTSARGHGGGWTLARDADAIALGEIQEAIAQRVVSVSMPEESHGCLVERAVGNALDDAVREANRVLDARLATVTLAHLLADVHRLDAERARGSSAPGRPR
ncbi:MAG TPA: Rrf2 family transcriptional regulator [Longimicrobium sp.]|jgi:Rrf2 family protein